MNPNVPQQRQVNPNNTLCDDVLELVPAYVAGAADASDIELIESMLYDCPQIVDEIELYTRMMSDMLVDVPAAKAPPRLRSNIQQAIRKIESESTIEPVFATSLAPVNIRRRPYLSILAVAASVLLIMNIFWLREITLLRADRRILDQKINLQNDILASLPIDDAQVTRLVSTDNSNLAAPVFVVWSSTQSSASLYAENLPTPQGKQVYQLWVIGEQGVISGGILPVNEIGIGILRFEISMPTQDVTQFGISLEPEGGSVQPSAAPVYVGEV